MTMKCWRRTQTAASGDAQVNKNPSQVGNTVEEGDGLKGMEFNPLTRRPYWQDPEKTIKVDE